MDCEAQITAQDLRTCHRKQAPQVHIEYVRKLLIDAGLIFREPIEDSTNRSGVKERHGCTKDTSEHAVVDNSARSINEVDPEQGMHENEDGGT